MAPISSLFVVVVVVAVVACCFTTLFALLFCLLVCLFVRGSSKFSSSLLCPLGVVRCVCLWPSGLEPRICVAQCNAVLGGSCRGVLRACDPEPAVAPPNHHIGPTAPIVVGSRCGVALGVAARAGAVGVAVPTEQRQRCGRRCQRPLPHSRETVHVYCLSCVRVCFGLVWFVLFCFVFASAPRFRLPVCSLVLIDSCAPPSL